ncbi:TBC1 domain family member 30-like [Oppia nitens]|uniref:TBC1 domain family member 30-like n=1 Tax=Oppia nitens TaxID=1686743 RepID=UPI0023DAC9D1|nr:TBC1 domain family member 30-like [Oppia nitens]
MCDNLNENVIRMNTLLLHHLRRRDRLSTQMGQYYDIITAALQAISPKRSVDTKMRFSIEPYPGDSGFNQWHDAMRMVARLPGGIPTEFRKKLWITLAARHIQTRQINWSITSRFCFNEKENPDDETLGVQIVKDLHRTGCSLFSGEEAQNQALLKQVLLAYARWNKSVGYCQGFNMLAAIILKVMEGDVDDSLKVMIYLIEGVLPESYFANNLRGLSVDMAVFRDLLRLRLSTLAKHLDKLQYVGQDQSTGASYEPPLINVFTMQWFLTLFTNCLPQSSVLRIWDLIFLEGNEVLLRAALAIWDCLADRILTVSSADEFYSIMGVLTREMMEFGVTDTNELVKTICIMAPFPFPQLCELREKYMYNIQPLTSSVALSKIKKGLHLFNSDDEDDGDLDDDQMMLANWCINNAFSANKIKDQSSRTPSPHSEKTSLNTTLTANSVTTSAQNVANNFLSSTNIDTQRMTLDISLLKKQYAKLKERQRQAQVIITEGFQKANTNSFIKKEPLTMNHLLLGKTALIARRPKRPSPVLQTATRANHESPNRQRLRNRSNTVADLMAGNRLTVNSHKNSTNEQKNNDKNDNQERSVGETLSWTQIKLDKKRLRFQRKLSEPTLSSFDEIQCEDSVESSQQNSVDDIYIDVKIVKNESLSNSSSSSSTELCDDQFNDNSSDFASSPEVHRKCKHIATANQKQFTYDNIDNDNNDNNLSETNIAVDEVSKCDTKSIDSTITTTATTISPLIATDTCLIENNNRECDSSLGDNQSAPIPKLSVTTVTVSIDNNSTIDNSNAKAMDRDNGNDDYHEIIKSQLSELSVEQCIQKLNEKLVSLNDENIKY